MSFLTFTIGLFVVYNVTLNGGITYLDDTVCYDTYMSWEGYNFEDAI